MEEACRNLMENQIDGTAIYGYNKKKDFDNKDEDFYSSDVRSCE